MSRSTTSMKGQWPMYEAAIDKQQLTPSLLPRTHMPPTRTMHCWLRKCRCIVPTRFAANSSWSAAQTEAFYGDGNNDNYVEDVEMLFSVVPVSPLLQLLYYGTSIQRPPCTAVEWRVIGEFQCQSPTHIRSTSAFSVRLLSLSLFTICLSLWQSTVA